jgi:hypothetical protein
VQEQKKLEEESKLAEVEKIERVFYKCKFG